jgi:hypothetical protein
MTKEARKEMQLDALNRAANGQSLTNYPAIFEGFAAKGIPIDDIKPRENIFSFNAWKAAGRVVRKGEHGVKVVTFIETEKKSESGELERSGRRPWSVTVFHISQTEQAAS